MTVDLAILALGLGLAGIVGGFAVRRWRWSTSQPSDEQCVSCGSEDLVQEQPGVYRCRACGYEGGSRRGVVREQAEAERYAALPEAERISMSTDRVQTAMRILSNYSTELMALEVAALAVGEGDLSGDEGYRESNESIARDLFEAADLLRTAARISGGQVTLTSGNTFDADAMARSLVGSEERVFAAVTMRKAANEAHSTLSGLM